MQYAQAPEVRSVGFETAKQTAECIERHSHGRVNVEIDEQSGTVEITGRNALEERLAADVFRAVRYGFDIEEAVALLDEDRLRLDTVDITRFTRNDGDCRRLKGRVIGKDGRTRELLEELTGATVVVHDKQVSAIGEHRALEAVRRAVAMLLNGCPHSAVYEFLEQHEAPAASAP